MPALPDAPKVVRFDLFYEIGTDAFAKNRFFFQYAGSAPSNTELVALATAASGAWSTDLKGLASTLVLLKEVACTDLTSSVSAFGSFTGNVTGTRSGAVVGGDACVLESLEIARRYRGGHPRIYWPFGVSADLQTLQTWTTALVSAATSDLSAFYAAIQAAVWSGGVSLQQVNVSYYSGFTVHTGVTGRARNVSTPRGAPVIDVVTGDIVREGVATQRKRLLRLA